MLHKRDIPNLLTFARLAAVPLLLISWYLPAPLGLWLPLVIVAAASLTDFLDGYLARRWQVESDIGRLLDPPADKLLMAAVLLLLMDAALASPIAVVLIICRELFVSALREYMAQRHIVIHVTVLAKWKTATQMLSALVLLFAYAASWAWASWLGSGLLWLATLLTIVTGWEYWRGVRAHLRG